MKTFGLSLLLSCLAGFAAAQQARRPALAPMTGNLEVSGGNLYYETLGEGAPVVLIHGGFGDRRMWDGQFRALASSYKVIRYDHRGFGRSSAPQGPYSPVADLLSLLDKLKVGRAHLVGNSLGGTLAIDFALAHPERVASLVVVASAARGLPFPQEDIDRVMAVFKTAAAVGTGRAAEQWLAHPMVAVTSGKPGARETLRLMVTENRGVFLMNHWPSETSDPPAARRLKELNVPTLFIIGGRDTAASRKAGEDTAAQIKGAKVLVMAEGDHLPQMVSPAEFNRRLLAFLRSL